MALTTKKSSKVRGCCEAIWRKTPCLPSPKLVSLTPPCPKVRQSSDNLSTNKTNPGNSIPCDLGCLGASSEILAFGDYPLEHRKVGAFYASTAAFQIANGGQADELPTRNMAQLPPIRGPKLYRSIITAQTARTPDRQATLPPRLPQDQKSYVPRAPGGRASEVSATPVPLNSFGRKRNATHSPLSRRHVATSARFNDVNSA